MALSSFSLITVSNSVPVGGYPARNQVRSNSQNTTSTFVDSLWNNPSNADLISQFLDNSFCTTCARGSDEDCLPLYQRYSVQDYFFLEDYVKFKALRLNALPSGNLTALKAETSEILSDAESAIRAGQSYVKDLHGKASDLTEGSRNVEEQSYWNWLQKSALEEDWFSLHVMLIPCNYGWTKLADKLLNDPLTRNGEATQRRHTIFYRIWIQPNADLAYANNLSASLDANEVLWKDEINISTGSMGKWNDMFRTALELEIVLFASVFDE
ncbi:hypothetical protein MMC10_001441 [Thelotrema lepadinum]|nr:hypothetical protein [Thelotrema lepadinum]